MCCWVLDMPGELEFVQYAATTTGKPKGGVQNY
jgi:hypothetical protein